MILKKSKTKWIEVDGFEGVKVKIDYPTIEQDEELRELFFQSIHNNPNYTKDKKAPDIILTIEQRAKENILSERIAKFRIKFCVKDWEGIKDEGGKNIKLEIVNNEIEDELFAQFIRNFKFSDLIKLGTKIQNEISFNDADKKKFISVK